MSNNGSLSVSQNNKNESQNTGGISFSHAHLQAVLKYRSRPSTEHVREFENALVITVDEHASKLGEEFIVRQPDRDNSKRKLWEDQWKEICIELTLKYDVEFTLEYVSRIYDEIVKQCMETRDVGRMPRVKVGDTVQGSFVWAIASLDAAREVVAYVDEALQGLRALPEGTEGDAVLAVEGVAKLLVWFDGSIGAPSLPHDRRRQREFLLEEVGAFKDLLEFSIQGLSDDHFVAFASRGPPERRELGVLLC